MVFVIELGVDHLSTHPQTRHPNPNIRNLADYTNATVHGGTMEIAVSPLEPEGVVGRLTPRGLTTFTVLRGGGDGPGPFDRRFFLHRFDAIRR
ncbi:hypothetical protein DFR67_13120 [Williamsia limnetica]|uniref:Uncharacterized protein n=1 Tax=Williamsia limnetica TaxID=882452 RepID=A0A318RFN1_WILLI|nr:hypothetical protein DFR67_13120 [Williamsia limnetica]